MNIGIRDLSAEELNLLETCANNASFVTVGSADLLSLIHVHRHLKHQQELLDRANERSLELMEQTRELSESFEKLLRLLKLNSA